MPPVYARRASPATAGKRGLLNFQYQLHKAEVPKITSQLFQWGQTTLATGPRRAIKRDDARWQDAKASWRPGAQDAKSPSVSPARGTALWTFIQEELLGRLRDFNWIELNRNKLHLNVCKGSQSSNINFGFDQETYLPVCLFKGGFRC